MMRRTLADWKQLIELQADSGLSIVAFCKQKNLPSSNFYKYRNRLSQSESLGDFVKAERINIKPSTPNQVILAFGDIQLMVNDKCDTRWLAQLMKELHA